MSDERTQVRSIQLEMQDVPSRDDDRLLYRGTPREPITLIR